MTTLETLKAARKLIMPKKRWTQGQLAKSAKGRKCRVTSPLAVCWCAAGAILVQGSSFEDSAFAALRRAMRSTIWKFNDTRTHAEVLRAFDEAINSLESST